MTEPIKNRRRAYRIFFLNPKFQLRYSFFYAGIALSTLAISSFLSIFFLVNLVSQSYEGDPGVGILSYIWSTIIMNWQTITLLTVGYVSAFFLFAFVLSKNIVGPISVIVRHIDELKKGNYEHRIRLRKSDELKPLMVALNELAENLNSNSSVTKTNKSA